MANLLFAAAVVILGLIVLIVTLFPFAPTHAWWVRAWDFPRVQILIFGVVVAVAALFLGGAAKWIFIAVLLAACAYQAVRIFPAMFAAASAASFAAVDN